MKKTKFQQAIEQACFESLQKTAPEVIDAIRRALEDKIPPAKLGEWITRIFPNSITAASVELAARYMKDHPGLTAKNITNEGSD